MHTTMVWEIELIRPPQRGMVAGERGNCANCIINMKQYVGRLRSIVSRPTYCFMLIMQFAQFPRSPATIPRCGGTD